MEQDYTPSEGEKKVIQIIKAEKTNWEDGAVFVTDNYQMMMTNVVKKARRNYLGIYKEPKDPVTKRNKIWIPFTEWIVETLLKNIDIDTKDITVKAKNQSEMAYLKSQLFGMILKKKLDDVSFGKTINRLLRRIAIDGTGFLKAIKDNKKLRIDLVERLNMLYDQTVEIIASSSGITERYVYTKPEFDNLELDNSEYVKGLTSVTRGSTLAEDKDSKSEIPYVEVRERYRWFPKSCLTSSEEDNDKYFYGHAIVSNIENGPVVHLCEETKEDPYQDFKLKEVPNRADGRGIAEMLFNIQAYLNEVVNSRMNKERIVSLGLFKMSGNVTPQQFKNLFTSGGIKLDNISNFEAIDTGTIDPSSYTDEERAYTWGTRVTGTTQDDEVAGNRPATNALIEQQGSSKGYNLRIEDIFLDMEKFIEKKVLPIIKEELLANPDELVRVTGDPAIFKKIDEVLVQNIIEKKKIELYEAAEQELTPEEEQAYLMEAMEEIKKLGNDRHIPAVKELIDTDWEVKVVITDESINKATMAQMLNNNLQTLIAAGIPIRKQLRELYDVLGLPADMLVEDVPEQNPIQPTQPTQPGQTVAGQEVPPVPQPSQVMPQ